MSPSGDPKEGSSPGRILPLRWGWSGPFRITEVTWGHAWWLKICGGPIWVTKGEIGMLAPQATEKAFFFSQARLIVLRWYSNMLQSRCWQTDLCWICSFLIFARGSTQRHSAGTETFTLCHCQYPPISDSTLLCVSLKYQTNFNSVKSQPLTKWESNSDLVWFDSMCIRLVITDIMHVSAEQMMQSRDPQGRTQSDQRVVPRQSPGLSINDYPVSSDHCPAVSWGGQRECLWPCSHGLTIQERGCAVSGYCTACVAVC